MIEALGQLNIHLGQERGIQLAVRLGCHTGLVVVGRWAAVRGRNSWRWARRLISRHVCKGLRHPIRW